jgi:general secretion pathway protein K
VIRPVLPSERGAALLAVLVLVAILGGISAGAFERLRLSTAMAMNGASLDQARAYALGVEDLLALRIDDLMNESPEVTSLEGDWNGTTRRIPLPGEGLAEGTIRDAGNCFNLNSVVEGDASRGLSRRAAGAAQFTGLMTVLGVPEAEARRITGGAVDWLDSGTEPLAEGAEDNAYSAGDPGYRTGNTLFADPTEIRAVAGVTPEIYRILTPYVCALPVTDLSPLNVNTLLPWQAPLLAMMAPHQVRIEGARALIASRPPRGWRNTYDFWRSAGVAGITDAADPMFQLQVKSQWFSIDLTVRFGDGEMEETALVDARMSPARVVARRWGAGE